MTDYHDMDYGTQLDKFVGHIWTMQDRLNELREFEKQWEELFTTLSSKNGATAEIHILNDAAFRTYRWDKYQVLISDLLSIKENELDQKNENGLIRQALDNLKLLDPSDYLNPDMKVNFIGRNRILWSEEEKEKHIARMRENDAQEAHVAVKESLKRLFPKILTDFKISKEDINHLLARISSLAKEIKPIRHYFNHKYEINTTSRYKDSISKLDIDFLSRLINELFSVVNDLGLAYNRRSFAPSDFSYEVEISDQIDLILFGTIKNAIGSYNEGIEGENLYYWEAKSQFFKSDRCKKLIANPKRP